MSTTKNRRAGMAGYIIQSVPTRPIKALKKDGTPNKDAGKFKIICVPTDGAFAELNPSGHFHATKEQLEALATGMGINDLNLFLDLLNMRGNAIEIPFEEHFEGEEYERSNGETGEYSKDWIEFDLIQSEIIFNTEAAAMKAQVTLQRSLQTASTSFTEMMSNAGSLRIQALLNKTNKLAGPNYQPALPDGDADDAEATVEEDDTEKPKAKAKAKATDK